MCVCVCVCVHCTSKMCIVRVKGHHCIHFYKDKFYIHIYMHIYYKQTFQNDQGRTPLLVSANSFSATNEECKCSDSGLGNMTKISLVNQIYFIYFYFFIG